MSNQRTCATKIRDINILEAAMKKAKAADGSALFIVAKNADVVGWGDSVVIRKAALAFNLKEHGTPYRFGVVKQADGSHTIQGDAHWLPGLKSINVKKAEELSTRLTALYNMEAHAQFAAKHGMTICAQSASNSIATKDELVLEIDV